MVGHFLPFKAGLSQQHGIHWRKGKTLFIVPGIFGMTSRGPGASVSPKLDPQVAQNVPGCHSQAL